MHGGFCAAHVVDGVAPDMPSGGEPFDRLQVDDETRVDTQETEHVGVRHDDVDLDDGEPRRPLNRRRRRTLHQRQKEERRHVRRVLAVIEEAQRRAGRACAAADAGGHIDPAQKDAIQKLLVEEPGKRIVSAQEVSASTGAAQQSWKLAAEAELTTNFEKMGHFTCRLLPSGRPAASLFQ